MAELPEIRTSLQYRYANVLSMNGGPRSAIGTMETKALFPRHWRRCSCGCFERRGKEAQVGNPPLPLPTSLQIPYEAGANFISMFPMMQRRGFV
eukprot:COSAG02_NODE_28452_length_589_cov_1.030612_1_plen_93_part_01